MAAYRILTFDGGGIRGIYSARLLERLAAGVPSLLDSVDLLAGTSSGSFIALGLAEGLPPGKLVDLFRNNARAVFNESWLDEVKHLGYLAGAHYDDKNLKQVLARVLGGDITLAQLRKRVLVPTFDLDNEAKPPAVRRWKAKFFHNFPGPDSDGDQLVVDVAMRSSAVPVYFPTYQGFIDGGVMANNPSMAALAQALDAGTGHQNLADIRLFSLGSGTSPTFLAGQRLDWGVLQWARPLVSLLIDGVMEVADYECARLLGSQYYRLAPVLPQPIALDDAGQTDALLREADAVDLSGAAAWLRQQF